MRQLKGMESLVNSQLDSLSVFEERYSSALALLDDCPSFLVIDEEMPADEALKQHRRFFNQDLPDAVRSLQEIATQVSQPDSQTVERLKEVFEPIGILHVFSVVLAF